MSTDLRVTSDDPLGNSDITIALTARSVAPVLSLSSAAIAFGNALSDSTFAVTVGNTGTDTLNISGLSTPAAVFSQTLSDSTLEPGSEALLSVTFSSSEPGYWAGDLTLTSDSYQSGTSPPCLKRRDDAGPEP